MSGYNVPEVETVLVEDRNVDTNTFPPTIINPNRKYEMCKLAGNGLCVYVCVCMSACTCSHNFIL